MGFIKVGPWINRPGVLIIRRDIWKLPSNSQGESPQEIPTLLILDLELPGSKTEKINVYHLSHSVCGILWWQPKQTNGQCWGKTLQRMSAVRKQMDLSLRISCGAELRDDVWTWVSELRAETDRDSSVSCGHIGLYSVWTQAREGFWGSGLGNLGAPGYGESSVRTSRVTGMTEAKKEARGAEKECFLYSAPWPHLEAIPDFRRNDAAQNLDQR